MNVPKTIKPYHLTFCRKIVKSQTPSLIPVFPDKDSLENNCFENVENYVRKHGGSMLIGWTIWEWRNVMIEAEFHAVWQNSEGQVIDITPKEHHEREILFLNDPYRKYSGHQVDNRREALNHDKNVKEFIEVCSRIYELQNSGDLKEQHGLLVVDDAVALQHEQLMIQHQRLMEKLTLHYGKYLKS